MDERESWAYVAVTINSLGNRNAWSQRTLGLSIALADYTIPSVLQLPLALTNSQQAFRNPLHGHGHLAQAGGAHACSCF